MSDTYPRVAARPFLAQSLVGGTIRDGWLADPDGASKVVPADAIVIERSSLPPVEPDEEHEVYLLNGAKYRICDFWPNGKWARTGDTPRSLALNLLAIADHIDAHPPVDEERVEGMAGDIAAIVTGDGFAAQDGAYHRNLARRLIAAGWTKGGPR